MNRRDHRPSLRRSCRYSRTRILSLECGQQLEIGDDFVPVQQLPVGADGVAEVGRRRRNAGPRGPGGEKKTAAARIGARCCIQQIIGRSYFRRRFKAALKAIRQTLRPRRRNGAWAARIPSASAAVLSRSVQRSSPWRRLPAHPSQPLPRFRHPRHHDEGHRGTRFPHPLQQRHIVIRFTTRKHDIRIQNVSYEDILRLLLDLMAFHRKCAANLPGSCLFKADENDLCHDDTYLRWNSPRSREARELGWTSHTQLKCLTFGR